MKIDTVELKRGDEAAIVNKEDVAQWEADGWKAPAKRGRKPKADSDAKEK